MDTISKHHSTTIALERPGNNKRRYYRREQKLRIVEESFAPGASVSVIARKHDVNANIVFAWRRQYKRGQLGESSRATKPALLPILMHPRASEPVEQPPQPSPGHIEIHLADGRWLHISGSVDADTLKVALAELMHP